MGYDESEGAKSFAQPAGVTAELAAGGLKSLTELGRRQLGS